VVREVVRLCRTAAGAGAPEEEALERTGAGATYHGICD
jgi:hypothetical protein